MSGFNFFPSTLSSSPSPTFGSSPSIFGSSAPSTGFSIRSSAFLSSSSSNPGSTSAPSISFFLNSTSSSAPSSSPSLFSASTTASAPLFGFGSSASSAASPASSFSLASSSASSTSSTASSLFGSTNSAASSAFGSGTGLSGFGSWSAPSASTSGASIFGKGSSLFGSSASSASSGSSLISSSSSAGASSSPLLFGATSSAASSATPLFGTSSVTGTTPFGAPSSTASAESSASTAASVPSLFEASSISSSSAPASPAFPVSNLSGSSACGVSTLTSVGASATTTSSATVTQTSSSIVVASTSGSTSTVSTSVTVASKLPSEITGKTVEENFDPEIERTLRVIRRVLRQQEEQVIVMEDNQDQQNQRLLRDYDMPSMSGAQHNIVRPPINANNFEIKPGLIQLVQQEQFGGETHEDPNAHLANFLEICDTVKMNDVSDDAIRLRIFRFSLKDKAKAWLNSKPSNSFTTWNALSQAFLSKYFPPGKIAKLRNDIMSFAQCDGESLYEAWERFKELQRKCPHHDIPEWLIVQIFYNGLMHSVKITIDVAAGGEFMSKSTEEAYQLLEEMASNNYGWSNERCVPKRSIGMYDIDGINTLNAKLDSLVKVFGKLGNMNVVSSFGLSCDVCGGAHMNAECMQMEQAQFVNNFNRQHQQNLYSNTYNQGWRNHPNFSWKEQGNPSSSNVRLYTPPGFQQKTPQPEKASWELAVEKLINATTERFEKLEAKVDQLASSSKIMEIQLGQLATAMNSSG